MTALCSDQDFATNLVAGFNKTSAMLSQTSLRWRPGNEYQALQAYYAHRAMGYRADQSEY